MTKPIKGKTARLQRPSALFAASVSASIDVARHTRFLRARRSEAGANQPTRAGARAGEILFKHRPVFLLDTPPFNPTEQALAELELAPSQIVALAALAAASIGLVEVERDDGTFEPIGTCFRVPGGPGRILTSGHLMRQILVRGSIIEVGYPYSVIPTDKAHLPTRVRFPGGSYKLENIICAHPVWDLLVADLEPAAAAVPSLEIETNPDAPSATADIVAVIGFPLRASDVTRPDELEQLFDGKLERMCLAPGRAGPLPPVARPLSDNFSGSSFWLRHDATTLPGNSGSPVFSLTTGRVVAVHGRGGNRNPFDRTLVAELNGGVPLPLVCAEEEAMRVLIAGPAGAPLPPPREWLAQAPVWSPRGESIPAGKGSPALSAVRPDRSDFRDFLYRPSLMRPQDSKLPLAPSGPVWDQGAEVTCVGFALATVIGDQLAALGRKDTVVSARMLYEAAREHDEFLDDGQGGTSLRGAIKGFFHNGVCRDETARYFPEETNWALGIDAAIEAGEVSLGAYYKVEPRLSDTQLAICEAGSVLVSARVHQGWLGKLPKGRIPFRKGSIGTHAFVLLGYDDKGFIVQNSWGKAWGHWNGQPGLAHWSYQDWAENILDTWVLRLAPRAPGALDLRAREAEAPAPARPRRSSILGHVIETEAHGIVRSGGLSPGLGSLRETAFFLANNTPVKDKKPRDGTKYADIAVFLHDPFLDADEPARLVKALIEPFKKQKIYPFHIFHGLDAARSFMARMEHEARSATERYQLSGDELTRWLNSRAPAAGAAILDHISGAAKAAAQPDGAVGEVLSCLMSEIQGTGQQRRLHLVGLGLGSVAAQALAEALAIPVASRTLVDPVGDLSLAGAAIVHPAAGSPVTAALQGYLGTWTSLARATLAGRLGSTEARYRLKAPTIAEAALKGSLASVILTSISTARP